MQDISDITYDKCVYSFIIKEDYHLEHNAM
jgi:hypothetical protein